MTINIVGAGLSGLIAGNILAHRDPTIFEMQKSLPNNHSAVLRFRTSKVGDVLNIPFRKVTMIKDHLPWKNSVADALAYSRKNSGVSRSDRSITSGHTVADRWIAPPDLIERAASRLNIEYGFSCDSICLKQGWKGKPIISTIPMPMLMGLLSYPKFETIKFSASSGMNIKVKILNCEAFVSLLIPDPEYPFSRLTITGNELTIEIPKQVTITTKENSQVQANWDWYKELVKLACDLLGLVFDVESITVHQQQYAKIIPIEERERREFMFWATDQHNIFSLGRFATWRPNLLLDDLIQDIRLIDGWINDRYEVARSR